MRPLRNIETVGLALLALTFGILLMTLAGCASRPPTQREAYYFDIQTNVTPIVVVQTNLIPVWHTNIVVEERWRTNVVQEALPPVVERYTLTNEIRQVTWQTNTVTVTNLSESYVYKPGAGAQEVAAVGREVGNIFGVGGIVSTAISSIFALWGYARSKKSYLTSANLSQTVETMREFVKNLPNGAAYDQALVNWMVANQAQAGVVQSVISLIEREVSNSDAKEAARQVQLIIDSLRRVTPTTTVSTSL